MDEKVIYRKTAKGQEEMATRAHRLPARERSVLVLVDGKRTGAELIEKSRHFGDSESFLDRLIETGFIEAATNDSIASAPSLPEIPLAPIAPAPIRPCHFTAARSGMK